MGEKSGDFFGKPKKFQKNVQNSRKNQKSEKLEVGKGRRAQSSANRAALIAGGIDYKPLKLYN